MRLRLLAAVGVAITVSSSPLAAWNNFGHMIVAAAAYQKLNAAARVRVGQLLALNPSFQTWMTQVPANAPAADTGAFMFMLAATWPDAIKRDSRYHNDGARNGDRPTGPDANRNTGYDDFNRHKYWHFVDQPFTGDGTSVAGVPIPDPNAGTRIALFRGVLSSSQPDPLKSYDLVWLEHLIGDVHQPLHASTRVSSTHLTGDAGGNLVEFCSATASSCSGNLHAFWDDVLGTSNSLASAKAFAAGLMVPTATAADIVDAGTWIAESFQLAQTAVYVGPVQAGDGPFRATDAYATMARATARARVALAGARLAALLNAELR
jgi:hypothetical protein